MVVYIGCIEDSVLLPSSLVSATDARSLPLQDLYTCSVDRASRRWRKYKYKLEEPAATAATATVAAAICLIFDVESTIISRVS